MASTSASPFTALVPRDVLSDAPVICLMGWVGASDKALAKYAELVAEAGYPSVRSTQPTTYLFSPVTRPRRQWALALLRFLRDQQLCPPRRLVLYAFSNGGGSVIEAICDIAQTDKEWALLRELVCGFVFDSAPGYFHPYMGRRVLRTEMPPSLTRSAFLAAYEVTRVLDTLLAGGSSRAERYWNNMRAVDWGRPQLYLYSADDRLCDVAKLEELITEKQAAGQRVVVQRWLHSEHVTHLKLHPQEYQAALLPFLDSLRREPLAPSKL